MVIKNFKRIELKYRINYSEMQKLVSCISEYMKLDDYGKTTIYSEYLDTDNWDVISRSIEKPKYKEKVRIRCYGEPDNFKPVFLELKKKFKGVVYKRRVMLSRDAVIEFLSGASYKDTIIKFPLQDKVMQINSMSNNSIQISEEILTFLKRHNFPRAKVVIKCDRLSFTPKENVIENSMFKDLEKELRITIDSNLQYCECNNYDMEFTNYRFQQLIPNTESIFEIKCVGGMPLWLTDILSKEKIYPASFSKCGTAVQKIWKEKSLKNKKGV